MKTKPLQRIMAMAIAAGFSSLAWSAAQPIGCLIQPEQIAEVGSPVVGVVESILVDRGSKVHKGQIIAVLRNDVERATLTGARGRARADAEAQAALANSVLTSQRLTRNQELFNKNFISAQALDQSIAELEVARQRVVQAKEQQQVWANEVAVARARLDDRTIRSPIDGIVAERYVSVGERVEERPLVRVARIDPLRVEVVMPSALLGSVAAGQKALVTPDLAGAAPLAATVTLVDKILDAASGTFRVRLALPNVDAAVPAGLRCKVNFGDPANAAKAGSTTPAPLSKMQPTARIDPASLKLDDRLSSIPAKKAPARSTM